MSTPIIREPVQAEENGAREKPMSDAQIVARNKRIAALKRIAGIWANREDIPADSVDHQRQLRAEWR